MPKFVTENGNEVKSADIRRAIWYGNCGFWTDDWDKVTKVGPGIPACPKCKTPGFICAASQWFDGAVRFDKDQPGYSAFLESNKEKCYRHYPKGLMSVWEMTRDEPKTGGTTDVG